MRHPVGCSPAFLEKRPTMAWDLNLTICTSTGVKTQHLVECRFVGLAVFRFRGNKLETASWKL